MHKRLISECLIDLEINTEGPVLVKSGAPGIAGSDMTPVVTWRRGARPEPYLPGSSLKGTLRSHTERIARTICYDESQWKLGACNPFGRKEEFGSAEWEKSNGVSCSDKLQVRKDAFDKKLTQEEIDTPLIYRDSCPICKIYGNTSLLGRFSIGDAYLTPESRQQYKIERRDMMGIDRFTGGASGTAKFDLEVLINATFKAQVKLTNFELWQLGLVAFVLRDLGDGLIPLGMGKSRGLGQVGASVKSVQLSFVRRLLAQESTGRIFGLYPLEREEDRKAYGYWRGEEDGVMLSEHSSPEDYLGLRTMYKLESGTAIKGLWTSVAPLTTTMLEKYQIPNNMRGDYLESLRRHLEGRP